MSEEHNYNEDSNEAHSKLSNQSIDTQIFPSRSFNFKAMFAAVGPHPYRTSSLTLALQNFKADHKFTIREVEDIVGDISNGYYLSGLLDALKAQFFGYELTSGDLSHINGTESCPPPVIRAAEKPNAKVLRNLLGYDRSFYPDLSRDWFGLFALLEAIQKHPASNVILLLLKGADPNGCSYQCLSVWSAHFLRFRPFLSVRNEETREFYLAQLPVDQNSPITEKELEARRSSRARFWAELDDRPKMSSDEARILKPVPTALELAARLGHDDEIIALCLAGADTTAWRKHYTSMPKVPTLSYISPTTPLHAAIDSGKLATIERLITLGFATDVFPLAAIASCLNPVMAALATEPADLDAYEILAPHADLDLVTPIFKVHILHIAVATLSLRVLQRVCQDIHLSRNPTTALHHTLLHIACLPLIDEEINHFSPKIHASIHDLRTLRSSADRLDLWPHEPPRIYKEIPNTYEAAAFPSSPSLETLDSQTTTVSFLLEKSLQDVTKRDIHGNTALHYLSGQRRLNEPLIKILRLEPGGEETWMRSENKWGFTPRELYEEGKDICEDLVHGAGTRCMPFWNDPMGTPNPVGWKGWFD